MSAQAAIAPEVIPARYFVEFVEGRRGEILDAALAVFTAKGYEGGTVREVAALLAISEPALYRYYPGKEALYADLVARAGDHVVALASQGMLLVQADTLRESLREVLSSRKEGVGGMSVTMRTLLISSQHNEVLLDAFRSHFARPMAAQVRALIPRVDAGFGITRSPAQLDAAVRAFMSQIVGYAMTGLALGIADDHSAAVDSILAVMGWDEPASA